MQTLKCTVRTRMYLTLGRSAVQLPRHLLVAKSCRLHLMGVKPAATSVHSFVAVTAVLLVVAIVVVVEVVVVRMVVAMEVL